MGDRRLLLIAMSGVRIYDDELRELGMTLPGFIERGEVIASLPSLGLLTIAGATPVGWEIVYREIDSLNEEQIHVLADEGWDLVGVSSLTARIYDAYRVLKVFRERGIPTVIGGLHASVLPEEATQHSDAVVVGEGEYVWGRVIQDCEESRLKGLYDAKFSKVGLEETPLPRWDLLEIDRYNRFPLQTTRGCPLDCSFCGASRLISQYKRKPISRIREELESILSIWPGAFIELADDNTFVNKKWGVELATLMAEYPEIRWFTESDISVADNEELLKKLSESGCAQVLIGLESVSSTALAETDSGGWKSKQMERYLDRISVIQENGISVNGCFAFGFDDDDIGVFERTRDWIEASGLNEVQLTLLTPFPGTALFDKLRTEDRLLAETFWDQCTLFDVVFEPKQMTATELRLGFRDLVKQIYSTEASANRKARRLSLYRKRKR